MRSAVNRVRPYPPIVSDRHSIPWPSHVFALPITPPFALYRLLIFRPLLPLSCAPFAHNRSRGQCRLVTLRAHYLARLRRALRSHLHTQTINDIFALTFSPDGRGASLST